MSNPIANQPKEQAAIRDSCNHPSGSFVNFSKDEIDQSIPDRFEKIVSSFPDRIAVKTGKKVITYAELNALANRIAQAIWRSGANDTTPIGILLDKGGSQIAAMLGVLKAGRFFTLLDLKSPSVRIKAQMKDSRCPLVIASRQHASLAGDPNADHFRLIDFEASACGNERFENLKLKLSPDSLACVIYTSGSTGQPKGVIWNHRNWLHKILLSTNQFLVCPEDRITLLPANSPNAITTIFLSVLNGATLLPFDVRSRGLNQFKTWLAEEQVSFCLMSAPLFRALCESLTQRDSFPNLRLLRVSDESVNKNDVSLFKQHFSKSCIFVTGLSIAETGYVRIYYVDHNTEINSPEVPVGFAVADKETLLIDDNGCALGDHGVGEIVVRSRYLSQGYWNRPDLTKAKFRCDPQDIQIRLYRTGDLGLQLPDGRLIHKGRKDSRVKIRGYGVDMIEVENALSSHARVKEAVIIARSTSTVENRLIAYYTCNTEPAPTVDELRGYLEAVLADYMIPSAFVQLESIPLTPNGKIDRVALPDPSKARPELDTPFVAPKTPVEKQLASIWKEVLALDRVGVHDNFFDLGGHSLTATRLVSQVIRGFQLELPLQSLFQSPTVAEMATTLTRHQAHHISDSEFDQMLWSLENMSEKEAQKMLNSVVDPI